MKPADEPLLYYGSWRLHTVERRLTNGEQEHRLTNKECQLLETLIRHQGQVLTRQFLMQVVWQTDYAGDTRTVEVHIHWLRQKLEDEPASPVHLQTVRGVGYVLQSPESG